MAALTSSQVKVLHTDGGQLRHVTYTVAGATSGDTWLCSTEFAKVIYASWLPVGGSSTGGFLTVSTNTTVTVPAGASVDSAYLDCLGESA